MEGTNIENSQNNVGHYLYKSICNISPIHKTKRILQHIVYGSRTDKQVSSLATIVKVSLPNQAPHSLLQKLNAQLPWFISVIALSKINSPIDPKTITKGANGSKTYRYLLEIHSDWNHDSATQAAQIFNDSKNVDFINFYSVTQQNYNFSTKRSIQKFNLIHSDKSYLEIVVKSDGFLTHQVRKMVNAIKLVGHNLLSIKEFSALVHGGPANISLDKVPGVGLILEEIELNDWARCEINWTWYMNPTLTD